jgi:hypothetical protein
VVPSDVLSRLIASIIPGMRKDVKQGTADLYGPSMVVFTLISILVLTMKNSSAEIVSVPVLFFQTIALFVDCRKMGL